MNSLVNRRMFKGKFYNDIKDGILKQYSELYLKEKLYIQYNSLDCIYYFTPCLLTPIIDDSGIIRDGYVPLNEYDNLTAIKLFKTKLTEADFEREYDDYSFDYVKKLEEDIRDFVKAYEEKGFIVNIDIDNHNYYVSWYHPDYSEEKRSSYSSTYRTNEFSTSKRFAIIPISKATYKSCLNQVKRCFKNGIEKLNKKEGASFEFIK